ncbi:MAG: hypothetical protein JW938_00885 [Candidatus Omnitrophica bacterium]|nr:hypothetical protein [Candidatus Omnitrophota bacterium]
MTVQYSGQISSSLLLAKNVRQQEPLFAPACIKIVRHEILVVDEIGHKIFRFDTDLEQRGCFGKQGKGPGEFWYPSSLCCDSEGCIYVADKWNHRIQVFDENGVFMRQIGAFGTDHGTFNEPCSVAWKNGTLYVAERTNGRLQAFNEKGHVVAAFENNAPMPQFYESRSFKTNLHYKRWLVNASRFCSMDSQFEASGFRVGVMEYPEELMVLPDGNVVVIDKVNNIVAVFSPDLKHKQYIHADNKAGSGNGGAPGIINCGAVDDQGVLWLGSDQNKAVMQKETGMSTVLDVRVGAFDVKEQEFLVCDFWDGQLFKFGYTIL